MTTQRISPSGGHFFHGLCGLPIWDREDDRVLAHHVAFGDRLPNPGESATIGLLDVATADFQPVACTTAWNFLLGSLAQFVGAENKIWFNSHAVDGRGNSSILDMDTDKMQELDSPIFWVEPAGQWGVGYDMGRTHWCLPGYSYVSPVARQEPYGLVGGEIHELADTEDGLRKVYADGTPWELLISYHDIGEMLRPHGYEDEYLFIRRIYGTDNAKRIAFTVGNLSQGRKLRYWLMAYDLEKREAFLIIPSDQEPRGITFKNPGTLMLSLQKPPLDSWTSGVFFYNFEQRSLEPFTRGFFLSNSYSQFIENGNHLVCGTFSSRDDPFLRLYSMRMDEHSFRNLVQFPANQLFAEIRCNLSPCVSRGGNAVVVDSFHEDFRGVYLVNLQDPYLPHA